jgi:hypothetical protein
MPAAPLVVRRSYLIVVPMPLARRVSQVLDRGAQAAARVSSRCASQVLDRGAQGLAHGAATLPQQEKNNSADVQRNRANIASFICTVVSCGDVTSGEFESMAVAMRRRWRVFKSLLHRLRLQQKTSTACCRGRMKLVHAACVVARSQNSYHKA